APPYSRCRRGRRGRPASAGVLAPAPGPGARWPPVPAVPPVRARRLRTPFSVSLGEVSLPVSPRAICQEVTAVLRTLTPPPSSKRVRLQLDALEDRLPVSETIGLALTAGALFDLGGLVRGDFPPSEQPAALPSPRSPWPTPGAAAPGDAA